MIQYKIELANLVRSCSCRGLFTHFSKQISADWHGYIISVSGHCVSLILKNCQTVAGIRMIASVSRLFLNSIFGGILLFGPIVHRPRNTWGYRLPWVYMIKLYCNAVSVTAFPTNVQPRYQITVDSRFKDQSFAKNPLLWRCFQFVFLQFPYYYVLIILYIFITNYKRLWMHVMQVNFWPVFLPVLTVFLLFQKNLGG